MEQILEMLDEMLEASVNGCYDVCDDDDEDDEEEEEDGGLTEEEYERLYGPTEGYTGYNLRESLYKD